MTGHSKKSRGMGRGVGLVASAVILLGGIVLAAAQAHAAAQPRTLCVYDPGGANGDAYNLAKDYRAAAVGWGVDFTLKPYTDERTAVEDFKAQKCDAVLLTGVRARQFNRFSATLEAMGSLPSYQQLETVVQHLSTPKAASLLVNGDYETVAIFPGGAVYLYLRSRDLQDISDLAGRRIATIDFDPAARVMVNHVGGSMVTADIGTFAGMFNNGGVDACYAPAVAYGPLELHKGLGKGGGIVRYPLSQLTFQIVVRSKDFPEGFGNQSRAFSGTQFDKVLGLVTAAERSIPDHYWIDVPRGDVKKYEAMFQEVRLRLRDSEQVYDKTMLTLMRRVRCKSEPGRAECATSVE